MNIYLKKSLLVLCVFALVLISGCSKESEENPPKQEEQIISNAVYESPKSTTPEQVTQFNALTNALKGVDDAKIAELVAVNFSYQFYSLANKTGKEDVGGLMFLPEDMREEFKGIAMYKYYTNYQTVKSLYGENSLPSVIMHEVKSVQQSQLYYAQRTFDGYIVNLTLKYAENELPQGTLKTEVSIQVADNNGVYEVIAAEDIASGGNGNEQGY